MGRAPCCDKANVKKGPWSPEEDTKLKDYIEKHGTGGNWIALPQKAGLKRCGKSCRLRWLNYLRPNIKHGEFSDEEDRIICTLFASIGSRWSIIAAQLPGRTDNDIKNYWNTKLKKKLMALAPPNPISQSQRLRTIHNHNNNNQFPISPHPPLPSQMSLLSLYKDNNYPFYNHNNNINVSSSSSMSFDPIISNLLGPNNVISPSSSFQMNNPIQFYHHQQKESNLLVFGSTTNEAASCSSNSDGSCSQQIIKQEDHHNLGFNTTNYVSNCGIEDGNNQNKFMLSYGSSSINNEVNLNQWGDHQKIMINNNNGYLGETTTTTNDLTDHNEAKLDYDFEDVKQLISSTNNNNLMSIDENKTQEKQQLMMQYYYY